MHILEQIVFGETVQEALALMRPDELLLAAGRAAGLSDRELAELFDIEPCTVSYRLEQARKRIVAEIPELRVTLSGRSKRRVPSRYFSASLRLCVKAQGVFHCSSR